MSGLIIGVLIGMGICYYMNVQAAQKATFNAMQIELARRSNPQGQTIDGNVTGQSSQKEG